MNESSIYITRNPIKKSADIARLNEKDLSSVHSSLFRNLNEFSIDRQSAHYEKIMNYLKQFPAFYNVLDKLIETNKNFEIVFPKGVLDKIKSGEYILNKSKISADEFVSFVRDKKTSKIVAQLRIKDVSDIEKWSEISASLQNMAVMQQLSQITKMLEHFEKKLIQIVQEFNNDRIGKIQSGYSDYLNALQTNDKNTKKIILCNAYSKLSEGRGQLIQSTKKSITEITKDETGLWTSIFNSFFSYKYGADKQKTVDDIVVNLFYIQRSTQVILAIKQELEEPQAMIQSLAPYNDIISFINNPKPLECLSEWNTSIDWTTAINEITSSLNNIPEFQTIKNSEYILKLNQ